MTVAVAYPPRATRHLVPSIELTTHLQLPFIIINSKIGVCQGAVFHTLGKTLGARDIVTNQ
jgi:hypothetical protein